MSETADVATPQGTARVHLDRGGGAGLLVLGHGAGGGVAAPDLLAATAAGLAAGWTVARVEQPYRVRGSRVAPRASRLDEAWTAVVAGLAAAHPGLPLVVGGRSSGARVACRTAEATGASGVLCLAFPLVPPPRGGRPRPSRQDELDMPRVPVLVVQGERDPFGVPAEAPGRRVVRLPGDHRLASDAAGLRAAVEPWLREWSAAL